MEKAKKAVVEFTKERDWDQFHTPASLSRAISIEAAELLQNFLWDEKYDKQKVCDELADVVNFCILLANKLDVDLEELVLNKLIENGKKYPIEKAKGVSTKYTEL
ncbi:MAG: nucleotide pyrophosphohydrolase [Methanobacteriaceae archaeon]|nr:nucleotide pyrophosphohydrolase [Methanobacteriaceae archaeon]